ncbi:hypothetical protein [Persephonella sp. KM09-Lau-8]|uniref:hypothetical protein n=1 Tax=Persephonella sp. KM09-Lau-8 TaxID=1158345 RepID=UPI0012DFB3E0|nr:hypothetical protein [Persephonella sp. KM09-Lau-8]
MNKHIVNKQINNKDYFAIFLFKIIVFFMVFDGIRDALVISSYISPIKDLSVFLLFFYALIKFKFKTNLKKNLYSISLLIFSTSIPTYIFYLFWSNDTGRYISSEYSIYARYLMFPILIYLFLNYEKLTGTNIINLVNYFLKLVVLFVIITPILYFMEPSFLKEDFKQWGRLGVGYPTMDAQVLLFALSLLLFLRKLDFKNMILIWIVTVGILMQNTGTGYVTLILLLAYWLYKTNNRNRLILIVNFGVTIGVFFSVFILINYEIFSIFFTLMQNKLYSIFTGSQDISQQIREEQFIQLKNHVSNIFEYLYGIGFKIYVENQYYFMFIGLGYVGLLYFCIFLFVNFVYGFLIRKKDSSILLISTTIFALTSYTLVSLYLFPIEVMYAFGIGLSKHLYDKRVNNDCN